MLDGHAQALAAPRWHVKTATLSMVLAAVFFSLSNLANTRNLASTGQISMSRAATHRSRRMAVQPVKLAIGNNNNNLVEAMAKKHNLMYLSRSQTSLLPSEKQFFIFVHDPSIDKDGSGDIIKNVNWHSLLLQSLQDVVQETIVAKDHVLVYDIGGNLGFVSMFLASLGPHVKVVSVEPMDVHHSLFKSSLLMNPGISEQITIENVALATKASGVLCMANDPSNFAASSVKMDESDCQQKVSVSTLEILCSRHGHPDIIKIDVEGFEPIVFQGGLECLRRNPPAHIISEFVPFRVNATGFLTDPYDFLDFMVDLGYTFTDVMCYAHSKLSDCPGYVLREKHDIRGYWASRNKEYNNEYYTDIIWSRTRSSGA